jgi:adenylate cyclase
VDKFTGDGIMALFGAPVALEDHARRTCYAGLEMQRAVAAYAAELREADGLELALRAGINSGEVIVGDITTAERFSYTAIGHTVGLGHRMESLAQPGSASPGLRCAILGPRQVQGSSRPIPVFELVGLGAVPPWVIWPPGASPKWEARRLDEQRLAATESSEATHVIFTG